MVDYELWAKPSESRWEKVAEGDVDKMLDESQRYLLNGYVVKMVEIGGDAE